MSAGLDAWEAAVRRVVQEATSWKTTSGVQPTTPDQVVTVKAYQDPIPADPGDVTRLVRVQVRVRQAANSTVPTANATAETVMRSLLGHGLHLAPGLPTARVTHLSTAQLGVDDKGRDERTDNYQITTTR